MKTASGSHRFDAPAREVLTCFGGHFGAGTWQSLGNLGGFSGAQLWRVETSAGPLCLRAWPPGLPAPERLAAIHLRMRQARAAGLLFVPAIHATPDGSTFIARGGHLWELATWMPGRADFHAFPTAKRLEQACVALAQLHCAWGHESQLVDACPAVERRLQHVEDWRQRATSGWEVPAATGQDPVLPWARRAWLSVRPRLEFLERQLAPWLARRVPVQPCLCDIWHDHVLFEGDRVSGLIDYGAVKIDNVAVDLARMLGSLVEDEAALRGTGLKAYCRIRPFSPQEEALIPLLDEATVILGAANWLKWLYLDRKQFENRDGAALRLSQLVQRIERWK